MAIFSEEGARYPDILVVCYLSTCFLISTILNPAVFLYNYRKKKNSVPVFLFKCLSVFDFLTCVIIPIKVINEVGKTGCFVKESDNYLNNSNISCLMRVLFLQEENVNDDYILLRVYSLLHWTVFVTPNFIAALMAICRFIQIRFPFFPLRVKHLIPLALMFGIYSLGLGSFTVFDKNSHYNVDVQVFAHILGMEKLYLAILVSTWPSILCQIVSVLTSILTIRHLWNVRKKPVSGDQRSALSTKSSLKILVTNFGSVLSNTLMVICLVSARRTSEPDSSDELPSIFMFITAVTSPVLLSCLNPIVFILFTPKFSLIQKLRPNT